ncbi:hypothetical protein AXE80_02410 [Wenyingzhuangia fucanilytica]|uniref:Lipid/polyisoprenoid-binding YceI-like domain-containing protein n=1 Tax=Wenyingzhuangia fucanilytica TaxID=1790137 RepID=A0A1B1Y348_9FLAO|nr:hypothetical protein [Wenyingzhuangia fucanilytica]ANW95205.1 hypothetical protein AXE80_02410 [Wenyingzhuangia fucanilytica]
MLKTQLFFFLVLGSIISFAQVHCGRVELVDKEPTNQFFTFDTFSKYNAGITFNNVARLKVIVENKVLLPDPLCQWFLNIQVDNNSAAGTPINQWEELTKYGAGNATNPLINILEIRVRNACETSPINNAFVSFTDRTDVIEIISELLPKTTETAGCDSNANFPGDYMTNYNEFNFIVDFRIKPGFSANPGMFQLNFTFHLQEKI